MLSHNKLLSILLKNIIPLTEYNFEEFKNLIIKNFHVGDSELNLLSRFLSLSMDEMDNWYKYIQEIYDPIDLNYSTMHNSKGQEFENVFIILTDSFNNKQTYFSSYFEKYDTEVSEREKKHHLAAQNLMYVATSRARINLYVYMYGENFKNQEENLKRIFGKENVTIKK